MWVKMRNRYQIKAKSDRSELLIYGDIGTDWWEEESNDSKTVVDKINKLSGDLDVRINSYGGVVADGIAIFNALRRYDGNVTTHVDGVAYSIGSLIAMAGAEIRMASNALLMIHAPWGGAVGNAQDMREMADVLDKHSEAMLSSYLRAGGPDGETVREWLTDGEDHYFTVTEALEAGLVDVTEDPVEMTDIAASLRDANKHYKIPAAHRRANLEKANMANEEIQGAPVVAPNTDEIVAKHSRVVKSATEQGVKAEASRRRLIAAVFDEFYDADPLNPITALHDECMEDTGCDELSATRKLLDYLAKQSENPIVARESYTMDQSRQAPPNAPAREKRFNITHDQQDKRALALSSALQIKAGLITDRAKIEAERKGEYLSLSITDIMSQELRANNYPVAGSREDIARRYVGALPILAAGPSHGSDHLPAVLGNIANLSAMQGWDGSDETWSKWTLAGSLNNYQTHTRANVALLDKLVQMLENQEWEHGDMADVKQRITGYFYGLKYSLSIQAIVNDDLGELARTMNGWGEAASATVGDVVHALLTTAGTGGLGQVMDEDSTVLFHADHSNYIASGSGAVPSETTLNTARAAMVAQTDPNTRKVVARPRYILHGPSIFSTVYKLLNSQDVSSVSVDGATGATVVTGDANSANAMNLIPVEEYRLAASAWMLAAARRTIEVAGVGGPVTPRADQSMVSNTPGITYELSMPFGAAVLDYRGMYYNAGA